MLSRTLRALSGIIAAVGVVIICTGGLPRAWQTVTHPYIGITCIDRTETAPPRGITMHIVQIDLTAPGIRFKLSPPAGRREVVRQTTLDYLRGEQAQIAINAHFFWPWPSSDMESVVIGIGASEGRVYSAFETPVQSYALVGDAPGINIDAENRAAIVHRDPASLDGQHVLERVTLWNTVAGSAQIVTEGQLTVPEYRDEQHPAAPLLAGGPGGYSNDKSWYRVVTARTAIGLSRDARTLTWLTVDVGGGRGGMTVPEVAETLVRDYGVWNALNLDGGGSTSMAMEHPGTRVRTLVNIPSDAGGRAVGSSLAVFARR